MGKRENLFKLKMDICGSSGLKRANGTEKVAVSQKFIDQMDPMQRLIEAQQLDEAVQYYHKDCVLTGPGENDIINGHQELIAQWKELAEMLPQIVWDQPSMDGATVVRRGHFGDWKFECRCKIEENKIKEVVTLTLQ